MHILHAEDLDTGEEFTYLEGDTRWMGLLDNAKLIVGQNYANFDQGLLFKLFGYHHKRHTNIVDTLIMSAVLNYRRFGDRGHAMYVWGLYLGQEKQEHEDWTVFSPEMESRCKTDVKLNILMYNELFAELQEVKAKHPQVVHYLKAETAVAKWCGYATVYGWPFDTPNAKVLHDKLIVETDAIRENLEKVLGFKVVAQDKVGEDYPTKTVKYNQNGTYNHHVANYFGIDPWSGHDAEYRTVHGQYTRIQGVPLSLDSSDDVKMFLYRNGWVPTQWNFKKDPVTKKRTRVKSSAKVTEDSLELLGGDGALYSVFLTSKSRLGVTKTWLEEVDENNILHGTCKAIGTPSMRATHQIIVNIPTGRSKYGKEMRSLFGTIPGWTLIGADSKGNQGRGLAYYLKNPEYIDIMLNKDIHLYNVAAIEKALTSIGVCWQVKLEFTQEDVEKYIAKKREKNPGLNASDEILLEEFIDEQTLDTKRGMAKRVYYAFLFGAGGTKLYLYVSNKISEPVGREFKKAFISAVPGFQDLLDDLEKQYDKTKVAGTGIITSLAGTPIYVDSKHKLLVYLLQAFEKITCSAAVMLLMERLEDAGIPYRPCIMYHDEVDFLVPDEFVEQAKEIARGAFADGGKLFKVDIMGGDAKSGKTWYEVH
jgi:hypothetical protein